MRNTPSSRIDVRFAMLFGFAIGCGHDDVPLGMLDGAVEHDAGVAIVGRHACQQTVESFVGSEGSGPEIDAIDVIITEATPGVLLVSSDSNRDVTPFNECPVRYQWSGGATASLAPGQACEHHTLTLNWTTGALTMAATGLIGRLEGLAGGVTVRVDLACTPP
jgi:hypothetical protein